MLVVVGASWKKRKRQKKNGGVERGRIEEGKRAIKLHNFPVPRYLRFPCFSLDSRNKPT